MGKMEQKQKARGHYIKQSKSPAEIALLLLVSPSTIYNWKREDEGRHADWDKGRRAYHLSPREMIGSYAR